MRWSLLLAAALAASCSSKDATTTTGGSSVAGGGGQPPDGGAGAAGGGGTGGRGAGGGGQGGAGGVSVRCGKAGTFKTIGSSGVGRYAPGVAVRPDGKVLIAGGWDASQGVQASALLLDPAADTLAPAGMLLWPRNFPAVARVAEGFLLVGGFNDAYGSVAYGDLYDTTTGHFRAGPALNQVRELHSATALPDGRVVVMGGLSAVGLLARDTAEMYDPKTGAFALLASRMVSPRFGQSAVWVASKQRVLVVCGKTTGPGGDVFLPQAEWFDPATGTFSAAASLSVGRDRCTVSSLQDGRLLIAGGSNKADGTLDSTELFDPKTSAFTAGPTMKVRRMAHAAAELPDGKVLLTGGWSDSATPSQSSDTAELFDPTSFTWSALPNLAAARHDHGTAVVDGCSVIVAGGIQVRAGVTTTPLLVERVDLGTLAP